MQGARAEVTLASEPAAKSGAGMAQEEAEPCARARAPPPAPSPPPPAGAPPPLHLLFLSYEFSAGTFSGNGVLAMAQVRGLRARGHRVTVVAAAPEEGAEGADGAAPPPPSPPSTVFVPVPRTSWGVLDGRCGWEAYAAGAAAAVAGAAARWGSSPPPPAAVLAVDWAGWRAAQAVAGVLCGGGGGPAAAAPPPIVFLNYRVFSRTVPVAPGCPVRSAEAEAAAGAAAAVALCAADAAALHRLARGAGGGGKAARPPAVLLPPLRPELAALPPPHPHPPPPTAPARNLLLCCVRLSPEKEPGRFADVVEALAARGALARHGLVPAVVGGGPADGGGTADRVRARVAAACPASLILPGWHGPEALAAIFERTALNVHPPAADAYGMTVVEAGSRGAPSIVAAGGRVGAVALLGGGRGGGAPGVVEVDYSGGPAAVADAVERLLQGDRAALVAVGRRAAALSREWDEAAAAAALEGLVRRAL